MNNHDANVIVGKIKMKLTLILNDLSSGDNRSALSQIERISYLLIELKKISSNNEYK
ncbi:MAG: hypothetical protein H2069_08200 [Legionella sp.]|nr:hypothetical protein [Legionella sp.]